MRDVMKAQVINMLDKYRAIINGEGLFLEKLETIIFDKTKVMSQFQGEYVQTIISGDSEIQRFIESLWLREVNQLMVDFYEEGKRQGHINPELSQEAILVYYQILRKGIFGSSDLLANTEDSPKLMRELMSLFVHGLIG